MLFGDFWAASGLHGAAVSTFPKLLLSPSTLFLNSRKMGRRKTVMKLVFSNQAEKKLNVWLECSLGVIECDGNVQSQQNANAQHDTSP